MSNISSHEVVTPSVKMAANAAPMIDLLFIVFIIFMVVSYITS